MVHKNHPNNYVDLLQYTEILPSSINFSDVKKHLKYKIDKSVYGSATINSNTRLEYGTNDPGDTNIYAFGVELKWNQTVLDRLILVIYSPTTRSEYNTWLNANAPGPGWPSQLPPVYSSLANNNTDPEPSNCPDDKWEQPSAINNNYHYDAAHGMRSHEVSNQYGHQAMYENNGSLIDATPFSSPETVAAAGTVDKSHYTNVVGVGVPTHWNADVEPFIRAAQLDGNPVDSNAMGSSLNQALIRVGSDLRDYYERRPPHTQNQHTAGNCIP